MSSAPPADVELCIKFDNEEEMFFSGEPVSGFVTSRVNKRLKVSVLEVVLLGEYRLFKKGGAASAVSEIVRESVKPGMDGKVTDIPAGTYDSAFNFKLGPLFPSSVACLAGSVVYKVAARCGYKLTENSDICTLQAVSYISVSRKLDLRECPSAPPVPVRRRVAPGGVCSYLSFRCCGDELQATLETPRKAYVCGERIVVSATIINQTSDVITESKIEMLQCLKSSFTKHKVSVVRSERGMVMKYSNRVWMNEQLTVPALPPSSDDPNLRISYQIRILLTRDDGKRIKILQPIIIGNVPLKDEIIESRRKELSFSLRGGGDAEHEFVPSYLVYRLADNAAEVAAVPSAPELGSEHSSEFQDIPLEACHNAPYMESRF